MKIRRLTPDLYPKADAMLQNAFLPEADEPSIVEELHANNRLMYEWVGIMANRVIAYVAFTTAYNGTDPCGLHLGPLAVQRDYRRRGIATELIRYAFRQQEIKDSPLYVLGDARFFKPFGFELCSAPVCGLPKEKKRFLSMRNGADTDFTVGYEPEFDV